MLVVIISVSSGYKLILLENLYNIDNNFKIRDSTLLSISIFGKSFYFINKILD